MNMWNPWHGCHKCSPGCKNCYVFYLDSMRSKNADIITKSKTSFDLPLKAEHISFYQRAKLQPVLPLIFLLKKQMRGAAKRGK